MRFAITVQSYLSRGWVRLQVACFSRRAYSLEISDFFFFATISVEQWRSSSGFFFPWIVGRKCVNDENLREICRDNVNCEKCTCNDSKVMCNLLVTALIIALLLIVSGNVELNPEPMKKCPECEKMMPTRSNNCKCGYLLCCVAARVLQSSAFIVKLVLVWLHVCVVCIQVLKSIFKMYCVNDCCVFV